jgi:hypothetical protein
MHRLQILTSLAGHAQLVYIAHLTITHANPANSNFPMLSSSVVASQNMPSLSTNVTLSSPHHQTMPHAPFLALSHPWVDHIPLARPYTP